MKPHWAASGKGDPLLLPRDAAQPWAHGKGQRVEEGAAGTLDGFQCLGRWKYQARLCSMRSLGYCWEGMGGYGSIVSSPCVEPGETHVLGKTPAKALLAGCCVSKHKVQDEISPCQGQVKANKHFSPTSAGGRGGSLHDTSASPHIPLDTQYRHRAKAKFKSNTNCCRPTQGPECSPQRKEDTEL